MIRNCCDAVFGPVLKRLPCDAPGWMRRLGVAQEPVRRGRLDWRSSRTGNTLCRGAWFYERGFRFDLDAPSQDAEGPWRLPIRLPAERGNLATPSDRFVGRGRQESASSTPSW